MMIITVSQSPVAFIAIMVL